MLIVEVVHRHHSWVGLPDASSLRNLLSSFSYNEASPQRGAIQADSTQGFLDRIYEVCGVIRNRSLCSTSLGVGHGNQELLESLRQLLSTTQKRA